MKNELKAEKLENDFLDASQRRKSEPEFWERFARVFCAIDAFNQFSLYYEEVIRD